MTDVGRGPSADPASRSGLPIRHADPPGFGLRSPPDLYMNKPADSLHLSFMNQG
jgi:hypothetical protein